MPARLSRAIVALAVLPWLVVSAAIPPEHVHEADLDHPAAVVHRHAEAHAFEAPHHDNAEFDHDEARVVWLNEVGLVRSAYQSAVAAIVTLRLFETSANSTGWVAHASHDEPPPHGPPRGCLALRAPPTPAA